VTVEVHGQHRVGRVYLRVEDVHGGAEAPPAVTPEGGHRIRIVASAKEIEVAVTVEVTRAEEVGADWLGGLECRIQRAVAPAGEDAPRPDAAIADHRVEAAVFVEVSQLQRQRAAVPEGGIVHQRRELAIAGAEEDGQRGWPGRGDIRVAVLVE